MKSWFWIMVAILVLLVLFFFPKYSGEATGFGEYQQTGFMRVEKCTCVGFDASYASYRQSSPKHYCFGIPHSCAITCNARTETGWKEVKC